MAPKEVLNSAMEQSRMSLLAADEARARAIAHHLQSIPGHPIPKDMEPEEPKPDDVQPT